jgi:transcriptional regulator with XRE-family HTH domain
VFGVTQDELAAIGGVSRTRVTRYEAHGEPPPFGFLTRLRQEARRRELEFSGDWFFEVPTNAPADAVPEDVQ